MGNLRTENKFITAIIEEKLPIKTVLKANFESTWLSFNADIWDWILNYYQTNHNLPSKDLLETRYPVFTLEASEDEPIELLNALREGSKLDRLYNDINETVNFLKKTENAESARIFLQSKLEKYEDTGEQDVFDLANDEDAETLFQKYQERKEQLQSKGFIGIPSGFGPELDAWLNGGLQNGNLYGILAPLGTGKTWAANIIAASALRTGFSPFLLALEGTLEKEGYRSLTTTTQISNSGLHTATISDMDIRDSLERLKKTARKFDGHYYIALHGNREKYTISTLRQKLIQYKPDIGIVDYLALMETVKSKGQDDWAEVMELSRGLKKIAVTLNIPMVATLQGNRASGMTDFLTPNESSNYGPLRDFDGIIGITKSRNKPGLLRIGDVKGRDTAGEFRAFYQSEFDSGRVRFLEYAPEGDF